MKKPVFLVESVHYQYEIYKPLIDHMGADVLCLYSGDTNTRAMNGVFDLEGNKIDLEANKGKYSMAIQTGANRHNKDFHIRQITDSDKLISMPHAIIGMTVDLTAGIPSFNYKEGIYLDVWKNNPEILERIEKYPTNTACDTHVTMVKVFEPPTKRVEPNTLGVILSNDSRLKQIVDLLEKTFEEKNLFFNSIYIKPHPFRTATKARNFTRLEKFCDKLELIHARSDKYEFTDRCQYIVSGSSSMYVEANLRSTLYNPHQSVYVYDNAIGAGHGDDKANIIDFPGVTNISDFDKSKVVEWHLYDDLLKINTKEGILNKVEETINKIIKENTDEG